MSFARHDAVHVVYGCGTTLPQELVVKLGSLFGGSGGTGGTGCTVGTVGFGVLRGYFLHEAQDIHRRLTWAVVLHALWWSVVTVPRTITRCWRQRRRWPWAEDEAGLQRPLNALRAAYGTKVAGPLTLFD